MIDYKIFTLPNGIDVLFLKRPEQYSVYIDIVINAGSVYETTENSGVSHYFEHLLFEGTKQYPSEQLLRQRFQEIGLSVNASTNITNVHIQASLPKSELVTSLTVLKDMVFESLLDDQAIEKERGIILDEQRQRRDSKRTQLWEYMGAAIFGEGHPLSLSPGGTIKSVSDMQPDTIRDFYRKHVISRNTSIILGGNFAFEEIEKALANVFLSIPEGTKLPDPGYGNDVIKKGVVSAETKEGNQTYFMLTYPSYAGNDLGIISIYSLLNTLLNEELHKKLRIEQGLLYSLGMSHYNPTEELGMAIISGSCNTEDMSNVLKQIHLCLEDISTNGFEKGMLERIRGAQNKTLPMRFDTLSGAMSWCVGDFHDYRKVYLPDEVIRSRNAVTDNDIKEASQKTFIDSSMSAVALGPLSEDAFKEAVEKMSIHE